MANDTEILKSVEVPEEVAARIWVGSYEGADGECQYVYSEQGDGEPLFTLVQLQAYGDARALAARDAKSKTCTWSQVDCFDMPGVYDTGCNNAWSFTEGDLSDNKIKYCPFCSGHIDAAMKRGEA